MKLPTLTAITLAAAVMAVPAFAANTPAANASGTATVVHPNNANNNGNQNASNANQNDNNKTENINALANKTLIEKGRLPGATVAERGATESGAPGRTVTVALPPKNEATPPKKDPPATRMAAATPAATTPAPAAAPNAAVTTTALPGGGAAAAGHPLAGAAVVAPDQVGTNNPIGTANVHANNQDAYNALAHKRNPVLADNGLPRAGKVIGSDVYNKNDKQIGSVDDILMGENGQQDQAVLNVNGANHKVLVPFDKLVFGNTNISGDNKVILPDQTQASLKQLAAFNYNAKNNNNNNHRVVVPATGMRVVAPPAGTTTATTVAPAAPHVAATAPPVGTTAATTATTEVAPVAPTTNARVVTVPNNNTGTNNGNHRVAINNNNGLVGANTNNSGLVGSNNGIANNNNNHSVVALPGTAVSNNPIGTATVAAVKGNNNANNNNANNALPHKRNPVLADNGLPRASKVIGSDVYDLANKKIGSVDGILMGVNGQPDQAVIDVNNANKKVLVPFKELIFGNTNITDNNRVILPKQTNASLATLPTFFYHRNNA